MSLNTSVGCLMEQLGAGSTSVTCESKNSLYHQPREKLLVLEGGYGQYIGVPAEWLDNLDDVINLTETSDYKLQFSDKPLKIKVVYEDAILPADSNTEAELRKKTAHINKLKQELKELEAS